LFVQGLTNSHWKTFSRDVSSVEIGDSIANSCTIITAIHFSLAHVVEPLELKTPPAVTPWPIAANIWEPFNRPKHSVCYACEDTNFNKDKANQMVILAPKPAESAVLPHVVIKYNLHCVGDNMNILAGSAVLLTIGLCTPLEACPNQNLFQHFFGIKFHHHGHTYVRAISTFEFVCCFNLIESNQYRLSHEHHKHNLDAPVPAKTSAWVFKQVLSHLIFVRDSNCEDFLPNLFAAPAATTQNLFNGAVCTCLPSREHWISTYNMMQNFALLGNLR
jgi:hypothetical protein